MPAGSWASPLLLMGADARKGTPGCSTARLPLQRRSQGELRHNIRSKGRAATKMIKPLGCGGALGAGRGPPPRSGSPISSSSAAGCKAMPWLGENGTCKGGLQPEGLVPTSSDAALPRPDTSLRLWTPTEEGMLAGTDKHPSSQAPEQPRLPNTSPAKHATSQGFFGEAPCAPLSSSRSLETPQGP